MMAAIRVVYVSDGAWYGGAERYLVRLGSQLDRTRFTPALILPRRAGLADFSRDAAAAGLEILDVAPGAFSGFHDPWVLQRSLSSLVPDIVHLNFPSSYDMGCGWVAALGRLGGASAVVTTEHIVDLDVSRRRDLSRRFSHRWIDRFIAISEANRRIMIERHGVPAERTRVILNGVEDPGPPDARPVHPFVVTCVGSIEPRKGQQLLLKVLPRLLSRGINAQFVFVGDGPERIELERETREADLAGHVRFAGELPTAMAEIQAAHVLAVPSLREGVPLVILEGMAGGAVVVSTNLPGVSEVLSDGNSGCIIESRDPAAWAETLAGLDSDRRRLERLAGAARSEFERRFRLERMVAETESLYEEILS